MIVIQEIWSRSWFLKDYLNRCLTLYKYAMPVWVSWWNVSQREDGFHEGGPHWHGIFVLSYRTNPNLVKYQWKKQWRPVLDPLLPRKRASATMSRWQMTGDSHISPLCVASDNGGHYADQWTWWLPTIKSANHGLRPSSEVWKVKMSKSCTTNR